jgi:hypothetical protein
MNNDAQVILGVLQESLRRVDMKNLDAAESPNLLYKFRMGK